jgi:hypothetical protein
MKTGLPVPTWLLAVTAACVACGELVGIHDVPTPADGGIDAPASEDARGSTDRDDLDSGDANLDGASHEGAGEEAPDGDGSSAPGDGAPDSGGPDVGAAEASVEAGFDAAACAATWNTEVAACNSCGIMQCCGELATCESVGMGPNRCAGLLACVVGYTGSPMTGDQRCEADEPYTSSEIANAEAALSCIRSDCPMDCEGL